MAIDPEPRTLKVFLSYSHDSPEHADRVLELCDRLRRNGLDAWIDQYVPSPPQGWALWSAQQVEEADYVLAVCTETYARRLQGAESPGHGLGVRWEGYVITQALFRSGAHNTKFLPVILSSQDRQHIPPILQGPTFYTLDVDEEYWRLYRHLTCQPELEVPRLGDLVAMPPKNRQTGLFAKPAGLEPRFQGPRHRELAEAWERAQERLEELTIASPLGFLSHRPPPAGSGGDGLRDLHPRPLFHRHSRPRERGGNAAPNSDLAADCGGLTKTHVLISGFPARAISRKCSAGGGLLALIRCGISPSGGGSAENETRFRFLR